MEIRELKPDELRCVCDPSEFDFKSTAELPELTEIIGQVRATRAIDFGVDIPCYGYNIFIIGPAGSGKTTTVHAFLEERALARPVPDDWCYVNNFEDPYRPHALRLPAGGASSLRGEMEELVKNLQEEIPRAFESEEYEQHKAQITRELEEKRASQLKELEGYLKEQGFALLRTPVGFIIAPVIEGQVLTGEQYEKLDEGTKRALEERRPELQKELEKALRGVRDLEKKARARLRDLDKEIAEFAIGHFFESLKEKYSQHPKVIAFLDDVRKDVIQQVDAIKAAAQAPEEAPGPQTAPLPAPRSPFDNYRVNVLVDNSGLKGAPVILETNPTYSNLIGRIEHRAQFGALVTDFKMIRGGALQRANGGYLIADARAILRQPLAWEALKRALRNEEIKIEELAQQISLISTVGLEPEPIPLEVKVVLIGDPLTYYLLYAYDEQVQKLFKVRADFAPDMDRTRENMMKYALFIGARCQEENLCHFDLSGVAKVVEYGSRLAEHKEKLTTRFAHIADIVREASYWANQEGSDLVTAAHVQKAIEEKVYRSNRVEERVRELIEEGTLLVDTEGEVMGQVNGLSIVSLGDYDFGKPSRITAKTYLGKAGVINIEREAELSGRIHDKGVMILSGYLGGKYAQDKPLSLSASLCFEQSYEGVEGDSASSTELYALLSSVSGFPLKQNIAVTGSVSQQGEIQPVGGVTKKIEGFFDVCRVKGLTGDQGVVIPEQNVRSLMLREDVVEAVEEGQFHIYPVRSINEGISILTGQEAGERQPDGTYPPGTVNYEVDKRLRELAERLKEFREEVEKA